MRERLKLRNALVMNCISLSHLNFFLDLYKLYISFI